MKRNKISLILVFAIILSIVSFIIPAAPVMAAVGLQIDPESGNVGDQLDVNFTEWVTGTYYVYFDTTKVLTVTSRTTKHFTVPKCGSGNHNITLRTGSASTSTIDTVIFEVDPLITISPKTAQVGEKITVTGTGFLVNDTATIYFDSTDLKDFDTDSYGSFTTSFIVPESAYDTYDVTVKDMDNEVVSTISVTPKIVTGQTSAAIGEKITVSGNGFSSSSTVTFTLDGINTNATVNTNISGSFTDKQITIPVIAAGSHTLTAKDANSHSASAPISTSQTISINPKSGPADTVITITGVGFNPSKSVSVTYKGVTIATTPASITPDAGGNFTATIKAPKYAAGVYTISVIQGTVTNNASFTQTSIAVVDKTTGPVGSTITASGSGYDVGAKITIKYDNADLTSATTDANGSFSTSFKVPAGNAGMHKIIITDNINPITINFTTTAAAALDKTEGNVGSDILVSGNAFTPNSTITIKYDTSNLATATADASGAFSASLKIPASKNGSHTITVTDGTTTTTVTFSLENTAPATPSLTLPVNGDKGDALTKFQWTAVADPSAPVTYTLQIAQDSAFATLVIEETGLTSNSYQLVEGQKLESTGKDKPYYWRVKAIDAAANESNWSTPQTFTVGTTFPVWLWIIIFVLGGILILLIGLVIGRRFKGKFGINRS
jgi:hypothetical protein